MNVLYVVKLSFILALDDMREPTLERNPMNVIYVGKPSIIILTLENMREFTEQKPCEYHLCHKVLTHCSLLWKHERIPNEEKPHECCLCGKAFTHSELR